MSVGGWPEVMRILKASEKLLEDTLHCDEKSVAQGLDRAHTEVASILTYNDENSPELFVADCTLELTEMMVPNIIITDVPYGNLARWSDSIIPPMDAVMHSLHEIEMDQS